MSASAPSHVPARRRRIGGQIAWLSGGRLVAALLQALSLGLVARQAGPEHFGRLSVVLGLAIILQTLFDLGVSTFIVRERAAEPTNPALAVALRLNTVTNVALICVSVAALSVAGLLVTPAYWQMLPLALWISAERTADARLSIAYADGDVHINVINILMRRTVALGIFVVGSAAFGSAILWFSIGSAVGGLSSAAFAGIYVRRALKVASSAITFHDIFHDSWHYWVNSLAIQARSFDALITAAFAGPRQTGFYSAGSRLTSPLRIFPTSVASVILPAAARAHAAGTSLKPIHRIVVGTLAVMTLAYAALVVAVPVLVSTVLGASYVPAVTTIQIIVGGLPFAAAVSLLGSLLQARGQKHVVALVSTAATTVCLIGVAIGASVAGAVGAAVALSGMYLFQAVTLYLVMLFRSPRTRHV